MAGTPPEPECTTHSDCKTKYSMEFTTDPRACIDGTCVPLMTDDCPVMLPLNSGPAWDNLLSPDPIILGAFLYVPTPGLVSNTTRNFDLALGEMMTQTTGVYAGDDTRHKIVAVVCKHTYTPSSDILRPARHLMEDLKIRGIVTEAESADQQVVFEQVGQPNDVFFMIPRYTDQDLINLNDNGLVWHMLSGANALSVSYQPLMDMTEAHLRTLGSVPAGTNNMKVAVIFGQDQRFLTEMKDYIQANVTVNGEKLGQNGAATFKSYGVDSFYTNADFDYSNVVQAVIAFAPHVVIALSADEALYDIIPLMENDWDAGTSGQDRPFYILSP